ncbi:MAG: copper chaperone PCu(A)C [Rhodocyclaceae bacterium]|nr:copper chaperone PCu(A)C [Rhodocyclaceae bacterium]
MPKYLFAALLAALCARPAGAEVNVEKAWVRATVPAQNVTGAYMRITSTKPARLVGVRSPRAGMAEIHEMKMLGEVMSMAAVEALDLPAGKAVDLQPGGYHLMLMDLKAPAKAGDNFPITLIIEGADGKRQERDIKATVQPIGYSPDGKAAGGHMH